MTEKDFFEIRDVPSLKSLERFQSHDRVPERAKYKVGIFAASSNENRFAVINGRVAGSLLGYKGFGLVNGGYKTGGMGSASEGFDFAVLDCGGNTDDIKARKLSVIFSDKAIGEGLRNERGANPHGETDERHDFIKRSDGIIENSYADIAVEGGIGTGVESSGSMMNEWFKEKLKNREGVPLNREKPIIIIDKNNATPASLTLYEQISPRTINTLGRNIYILSGHKVNLDTGDEKTIQDANLENDSQMQEELNAILEYFFLKNLQHEGGVLTEEEKTKLENYKKDLDQNSPERKVKTLLDYVKSHRVEVYEKNPAVFVSVVDTRKQFDGDGSGI